MFRRRRDGDAMALPNNSFTLAKDSPEVRLGRLMCGRPQAFRQV
jgi:hypothetical protein